MADNNRSYRPADQRWPAQSTPVAGGRPTNDPLAELARLIGQSDPFADIPPRAGTAARPAPALQQPPTVQAPQPVPSYPNDPYGSPIPQQPYSGKPFDSPSFEEPRQESFQPPYDPAMYAAGQPQAAYPSEAYYDDPTRIPQTDDVYGGDYGEEERPRRGMKLLMVVGGLVIIGAGAAFGYRALYSGPGGPPPVIKANTAPSKIAPTPTTEANNNKAIYDRVGEASKAEKVVPREEKPVEVKDTSRPSTRVVLPGMPTPASSQDSTSVAMTSPPLTTDPVGPSIGEPKKIRTVTIRPDHMGNGAMASRQNAAPTRTASAAPAPAVPREPAPATVAAVPASNAPLSLSPQAANAEASARSPFPPPPTQRTAPAAPTRLAAVPPAAAAASSGPHVQLSSQRSENDAHLAFRNLQAKFPNLLGDRQLTVRRADLGNRGIYYRAMVGPFASVDQATQFCGSLKSAGGQCVVQRN
jgi:hypothetical protein